MKRKEFLCGACAVAVTVAIASFSFQTKATDDFTKLPAAGAAVALGEGGSYIEMQEAIEEIVANTIKSASPVGIDAVNLQDIAVSVSIIKAEVNTNENAVANPTEYKEVQEVIKQDTLNTEAQVGANNLAADLGTNAEGTNEVQTAVVPSGTVQNNEAVLPEDKTVQPVLKESQPTSQIATDIALITAKDAADTTSQQSTVNTTSQQSAANTDIVSNAIPNAIPSEELQIPGAKVEVTPQIVNEYANLVIAQVNDYVNVRATASTDGEVVGKLYDNSVGTLVSEENGWYQIQSGNVLGYVKAEYCVTGDAAIALVEEVGTRIATVNTTTLYVRENPGTDSKVLGMIPIEEELVVTEELDGWVKVSIEEGDGYISTEFVDLRTDFVKAESKAEEEARLAKEAEARKAAQAAAAAASAKQSASSSNEAAAPAPVISGGSDMGNAVAQYAVQFVGNPYVYGGSSLTNGTDCSGFVMSVYANYGVSLPHSSTSDRSQGSAVDGLANAQPGDLICYSGHVALYIGNNQIVHASTKKTGIIISNADYKKVLAVRRIF